MKACFHCCCWVNWGYKSQAILAQNEALQSPPPPDLLARLAKTLFNSASSHFPSHLCTPNKHIAPKILPRYLLLKGMDWGKCGKNWYIYIIGTQFVKWILFLRTISCYSQMTHWSHVYSLSECTPSWRKPPRYLKQRVQTGVKLLISLNKMEPG